MQGEGSLVASFASKRIVNLNDRKNPGEKRDVLARQTVGIARPVELFVMQSDERRNLLKRPEHETELCALRRVALDNLKFLGRQRPVFA